MIIGIDTISNAVITHKAPAQNIHSFTLNNGLIDHLYIDEDPYGVEGCEKPDMWQYSTILNANFNGTLEGGSIQAEGMTIDSIKIQKRRADQLEWEDIFEIPYEAQNKSVYYDLYDKYIRNDYVYQYSIVPMAANVMGERVLSPDILADFDGAFLTDINHNYHLFYNFEISDIEHNKPSHITTFQGEKYPIVTYGRSNYTTFDVSATYIAKESLVSKDKQVEIRLEHKGREDLISFLQNGKPKLYRDMHGNLKLVTILSETVEALHPIHAGRGDITFTAVEIGEVTVDNLLKFGIYDGVGDGKNVANKV